jgi:isopropylmalate/homocitrate/citramalate synthase
MTDLTRRSARGSIERKANAFELHDARLMEGVTSDNAVLPPQPDVVVVEVGPRDGLQNETAAIPTSVKIAFVDALTGAGLPVIEVTSFVNPKAVPQLADAAEVMSGIQRASDTRYPVLVPNQRGVERAVEAGADAIALFTSATEEFAQANVGASIDGTFERFESVVADARQRGMWVRGYVSVAFGCPYSGAVSVSAVIPVAERLLRLGCDEVCLADTIGTATPGAVTDVLQAVRSSVPIERLALHFHDTSGTALANVEQALELGVRSFDSAVGGLGGCPFAPGAPGNLSTEQLIGRMEALGLRTGANSDALAAALDLVRPHVPRLARLSA